MEGDLRMGDSLAEGIERRAYERGWNQARGKSADEAEQKMVMKLTGKGMSVKDISELLDVSAEKAEQIISEHASGSTV